MSAHHQSAGRGDPPAQDAKDQQLARFRAAPEHDALTTDQGVRVDDTDNALRAGTRGPTLLEDFHNREKLTHFDHERIPERVVHARGAGAYGYFEAYEPLTEYTCADFLAEAGRRTPVFVRFSTVQGPRGSADTVRDVRGFATKFYTREGNYDLVGNNMPVFFIQDAIKFPDFVHAVKMEPDNEMPTGGTAHDTFWDFASLQPETTHMLMWAMSDRAIPRSFRMMQGFGVHTFRFVTADGRGTFVKFHWKPKLGVHSQVWDEAQITAGRDPDYHRRDLWEAIESGEYPEWELGVQLVPEEDEFSFDFDLLDATKIIPEEQVPVRPIGRLVLDRNPQNFFAETEQVAFHTANVVPGIDFTNDPLLQGRNFSYLDTQLIRLGGPNFSQLPVNRPLADVNHNHRDGFGQQVIHPGTNYFPNSLGGGCPAHAGAGGGAGVFRHYAQRVDGEKIRVRSDSFQDHYSQAALFWNSMADWERRHIVEAFRFELGKVGSTQVRERMVGNLANVNAQLAEMVADGVGVAAPQPVSGVSTASSPALSQENLLGEGIRTRKVAVLAADGTDAGQVTAVRERLTAQGAIVEVLAAKDGSVRGSDGGGLDVDRALPTMASVLYDAVLVPDGKEAVAALAADPAAVRFVEEAYRHGKPIAVLGEGTRLLTEAKLPEEVVLGESAPDFGVLTGNGTTAPGDLADALATALGRHRFPRRPGLLN
ncbi:catalase HPII [Streptomyces cinnamoneus]|uniref:Catalase n=1 Tax=Streptomyces cinnamoneus TaxID=53446 RepID=A0A2G1XNT6_STRCJ|nr:catalase [Streptomyces cinnamoneus]PHQ52809.1 catalase HPII [Streptomyces cinnamoneus]PPT11911.1 catalase [Streptomyces cinnamoneus]